MNIEHRTSNIERPIKTQRQYVDRRKNRMDRRWQRSFWGWLFWLAVKGNMIRRSKEDRRQCGERRRDWLRVGPYVSFYSPR